MYGLNCVELWNNVEESINLQGAFHGDGSTRWVVWSGYSLTSPWCLAPFGEEGGVKVGGKRTKGCDPIDSKQGGRKEISSIILQSFPCIANIKFTFPKQT